MITQKYLKEHLHYSVITGKFYWIKKVSKMSRIEIGSSAGFMKDERVYIQFHKETMLPRSRLIYLYLYGKYPDDGLEVDHINNISFDDSWINLRVVTAKANCRNKTKYSNNKTGITGVSKKGIGRWKAKIHDVYLGSHEDFFEACCARKSAENKYNYYRK